jgi:hypothetical protein
MSFGYLFFRGIIAVLIALVQWACILDAAVILIGLKAEAIHVHPGQRGAFVALAGPGCAIVAWWFYRWAAERYAKLQFWWRWRL